MGKEAGLSACSVTSRIKFSFVSVRTCLASITVNSIEMKHFSFYTLTFIYSTSSGGCSKLDSFYDRYGSSKTVPWSLSWGT